MFEVVLPLPILEAPNRHFKLAPKSLTASRLDLTTRTSIGCLKNPPGSEWRGAEKSDSLPVAN